MIKMNQWKRHGIELSPGTSIQGKWHGNRYIIKKRLGSGTVGTVYLCEVNGKNVALKLSHQDESIAVEVNVLKALQNARGNILGPSLLDVDDFIASDQHTFSFYVMEYLRGESLTSFFSRRGKEWLGVLMLQLLEDLEQLHQLGWVFGDLKMDNLIVLSAPIRIRLVDVGGTTKMGRSIKEHTEFYDRGYWGLGTRKAEPSYDLFAFVMVFIGIFYPKHFSKTPKPEHEIFKRIDAIPALKPYRQSFKKAVLGKYQSSAAMKKDLLNVIHIKQKSSRVLKGNKVDSIIPVLIDSGGIVLLAGTYYLLSLLMTP